MSAKNKPIPKPAAKQKHVVDVKCSKDDNPDDAIAQTLTRPVVQAARTIQQWEREYNVASLAQTLSQQVEDVKNGDMSRPEAMLLAQAHTLDELFNNLARRAHCQEQMKHYETFLRLAFKAQNQCRSTLETLAAIKNPPVIYAKQANISNGHQQINNGTSAQATQAEKITNQQNELLEQTHGERLDTRATGEAIGIDKAMATVE